MENKYQYHLVFYVKNLIKYLRYMKYTKSQVKSVYLFSISIRTIVKIFFLF